MKKISLQWRLTIITTLLIAIICGCLTIFIYKNGVYYIDSLQNTVDAKSENNNENNSRNNSDKIYIRIPDEDWNNFAKNFSIQVYNNKADYKRNSLIFSTLLSLLGGVLTFFISGHALKPLCDFSKKIEEVQAQNLSDSRIEESKIPELNQLSTSYNKMLERLSEAFEMQRQFTANAAHELRTPLAVMQLQIDLYNSTQHPDNDSSVQQTIKMITEQTERLSKMVRTLLDMSELQTIARDEEIEIDALIEEVLADLEPLAQEKDIRLTGKCDKVILIGSDILIYRLVYNLCDLVVDRIQQDDAKNGYVLDGFPRTIPQAECLTAALEKLGSKIDYAIDVDVPDENIVNRMSGRRACLKCGNQEFEKTAKKSIKRYLYQNAI